MGTIALEQVLVWRVRFAQLGRDLHGKLDQPAVIEGVHHEVSAITEVARAQRVRQQMFDKTEIELTHPRVGGQAFRPQLILIEPACLQIVQRHCEIHEEPLEPEAGGRPAA